MREGWEYKKLGEVCNVINGLWTGKKEPFINVAVIRNTNFSKDCQLNLDNVTYIDVEAKQFASRKLLLGDIIIEKSGGSEKQPVGRPILFNISEGDYSFSNFTSTLRIKEDAKVESSFLHKCLYAFYLKGETLKLQSKTTGLHNLNMKGYLRQNIPLPPKSTQLAIVSELDKINELIRLKKEQLKDFDNLAQSIFYEMFGDPVENEKGWEVKKLGEIGELARGVSKHRPRNAPELLGGKMPLIQTGDVANSDFYIRNYSRTYSDLGVAQSKVWEAGTLCITIAATIGKCAILSFTACFPDSVVGYKPNNDTNTIYMFFIFKNMQKMLEEFAPGVAQKNINLKILTGLNIPLPPLPLQHLFAQRIEQIEHQKAEVQKAITDLETLLASRMQYWFE